MFIEVNQSSKVIKEFSRFAHKYDQYNVIQAKVATTLVEKLPSKIYKIVLDIGCGSGEIFKNFKKEHVLVEQFIALDSSLKMLNIHPSSPHISKICKNFNQIGFLDELSKVNIDVIISSSALQWSNDLDCTIETLSSSSKILYAAVFTSGTFATLHKTAGVTSPIHNAKTIQGIVSKYYRTTSFSMHEYSLNFNTTRDMFKYIKQSGVSSGERKLSYKATKELMKMYPLDYLEFEVLFIEAHV